MRLGGGGTAGAGAVAVRAAVKRLSEAARQRIAWQAQPNAVCRPRPHLPNNTLASGGTSDEACQTSRLITIGAMTGGMTSRK